MPQREQLYDRIIEHVFFAHYAPDITQFTFRREELNAAAQSLGLRRALNPGDLIYTHRYGERCRSASGTRNRRISSGCCPRRGGPFTGSCYAHPLT